MKNQVKCFIAVILITLMYSSIVSASSSITKFQNGPFTCNIDLGEPCNNTSISKPIQAEMLSGDSYTNYNAVICGVLITLMRYDLSKFDSENGIPSLEPVITEGLLESDVDKDTIRVYQREIDGKPGVVGEGYVPNKRLKLYEAGYYISPKSVCYIGLWDNESMMISALKTIHITETK